MRGSLGIALGLVAAAAWAASPPDVPDMATFNIENFPRDDLQPAAAAREIGRLGIPVVAVQEIRQPRRFVAAIVDELGEDWVFVTHARGMHRVGLLVDRREYTIVGAVEHDEVRVTPGGRPALEVTLRRRGGWATQSVFVVHLKSGPGSSGVRRAQLQALAPIVAERAGPVTVLGDFNPVGEPDRRDLDRFASAAGLRWNSAQLGCTAFFSSGGRCRGVALDHVMSTARGSTRAAGACEEVGCEPGDRCPVWVSDHCPVVFSPRRRRSLPTGG